MLSKQNSRVLALLLILVSCVYEPTEEYFKQIEKANTDDITFELTDATDTIYLYQTTHLGYSAVLGDHRLKIIQAWLGETLVHYSDVPSVITLDPANIASGTYRLHVEIEASSGTNSMADMANNEFVKVKISKQWVVIVDKESPTQIRFTSIADNGNGQLELKWESYDRFNFQSYELTKFCYNSFYNYYEWCWTQQLDQADMTGMIDSSFVGGKAKYVIAVRAANQLSPSDEREIEIPYTLDVQYSWATNNDLKVTWRKPRLYKNLGAYELTFFPDYEDPRKFIITDVNDTTITFGAQIKFPAWKIVKVAAQPKMTYSYTSNVYGQVDVILGKIFPSHDKFSLVYNPTLNKYFAAGYHNNERAVMKINAETFEVEQSFPSLHGSFAISPNGQYCYVLNDVTLSRLDPNDFSVLQTNEVTSNYNPSYPWQMKVSNNNRLVAGSVVGSSVWDMTTFTRIDEFTSNNLTAISPDGVFLFGYGTLFRFDGEDYHIDDSLDEPGTAGDFTTDNKFIAYKNGTIRVYNLNTMSLIRSIPSEANFIGQDPATGLIGGFSGDYGPKNFYIFSEDQNSAINEFEIGNIDPYYTSKVLLNNQIICSCGNVVPLSQFE
jgi:hypothetical protein